MRINNLDLVSERLVPCVMNIIAKYYNDTEEIELDVPEDYPDYFVISINEDKYIIVSQYEESKIVDSYLDDDFEEWCAEYRVSESVRKYIDKSSWRDDHSVDIEDILECKYLTDFDRYNVYQCNN